MLLNFTCKEVTQLASDYVTGRMSRWNRIKYRMHIFICHDCRVFVAQFRATISSLRGFGESAPTYSVDAQVRALMEAQRRLNPPDS
ncbi:MAG: zf-HC2 domain-containing protein [Gammaproteobacteria bacterium]|nr:zf-HC2 domain-containing protein [Gammaproteobacteria bacterium]